VVTRRRGGAGAATAAAGRLPAEVRTLPAALLVGSIAVGLAWSTLLRDVGVWDTAEAQTIPPLLGTMHPTGFPAYVLLGWLASVALGPLGSPALAMSALSALLLGVAAAGTVVVATQLTGRLVIAMPVGLGLAATPVAWGLGSRADVHALHLALVALLLVALVGWAERRRARRPADGWLLAAAALVGLALANHRLVVLAAPGIAAFVLLVEPTILRRRSLVAAAAALAIGIPAVLYLQLPLRAGPFPASLVYGRPDTWEGFWYVVLGTQFGGAFDAPWADPGATLGAVLGVARRELGPLGPLAAIAFVAVAARRPAYAALTGSTALFTVLFAISYDNAAIGRYYAGPVLVAWTWLAVGAATLVDTAVGALAGARGGSPRPGLVGATRRRERRAVALAGGAVAGVILLAPTVVALPGRWPAVDARGDTGRQWLEGALAALPPGAVVVSWWNWSTPLWYAQHVEGRRPDLRIVDDRTRLDEGLGEFTDVIDANLGLRPVYAIRVSPADIAAIVRRYRSTDIAVPGGPSLVRIDGQRGDR
jgi:hypothetical protein